MNQRRRKTGNMNYTRSKKLSINKRIVPQNALPESIKDNPWNVHYNAKTKHPIVVLTTGQENAMIVRASSSQVDQSWIRLKDGLQKNQKKSSYVHARSEKLSKEKIQRKMKQSRITDRDKNTIYSEMNKYPRNFRNFKEIQEEKTKKKN